MITLENVDLRSMKGKNFLFSFSQATGDLTSVQIVASTSTSRPNLAGWLPAEYPESSDTEDFKLANAYAWLAVNAPGWGKLTVATIQFNKTTGKIAKIISA